MYVCIYTHVERKRERERESNRRAAEAAARMCGRFFGPAREREERKVFARERARDGFQESRARKRGD